ncbi:MAG: hypothetical protein K1X83_09360 [Oligoflexia bacterium]|nr:hypothetical protein [Oligoflexia bacterium]
MVGKPGPFRIIENHGRGGVDAPIDPPRRRYTCANYEACLNIACALNWDSFTCRGCNGEVDESNFWQAHQAIKKDTVADSLVSLPSLKTQERSGGGAEILQFAARKR